MSGKPVILYENVASHTASSAVVYSAVAPVADFPYTNIFSPFTYPADSVQFTRPTNANAYLEVRFNASKAFNSVGIILSGVDQVDGDVTVSVLDDISVGSTVFGSKVITADGCHLFNVAVTGFSDTRNYRLRIAVTGDNLDGTSTFIILNAIIGARMEFEKCIRNSFAPLDYNRKTEFLTNESGTGQYIGRSIIRRNHESTVSFDLMTAPWVRSTFQPFVKSARSRPYFFAWNPTTYPNEVNYVWTDEDIGVEYTGDRNRMSASWSMRGLGNDQE